MDLIELDDFHWLMDILQTIDVGLVVIDRQYEIQLWNGFMENHSGQLASHIRGQNLLTQFPDLPVSWLQRKVEGITRLIDERLQPVITAARSANARIDSLEERLDALEPRFNDRVEKAAAAAAARILREEISRLLEE